MWHSFGRKKERKKERMKQRKRKVNKCKMQIMEERTEET
jgi:hypothetical protein